MNFNIEYEQEEDGRWIADVPALPGLMAYGASAEEARARVEALTSMCSFEEAASE